MSDITISINNVSKTYRPKSKYPTYALKDISFDIKSNSVTGLIGPNGAGKSTLLRIILGFLKPDSGQIHIFDKSPNSIEVRKQLAYQADSLFSSKTIKVQDYLELHATLADININSISQEIRNLLNIFNLTSFAHKSLNSLSRGLRQKVELVQVFLNNPKLILLDEPTASLDPPAVLELRDYIISKKNTDMTILFSSHNLNEVEKICDRVIFINNGSLFGDYLMDYIEVGFLENAFRNQQDNGVKQ